MANFIHRFVNLAQEGAAPGAMDGSDISTRAAAWTYHPDGQMQPAVGVIVVDDDAHIRRVISQELLADARIDLLGQADSLRTGKRLMAQHAFSVMLVDLNLGDGSGYELIEHMKATHPRAEAIVISAAEDEQHAIRAFALGAAGYLVKNSWFDNFPQAVLQVVNGGAAITPSLARRLLKRIDGVASHVSAPGSSTQQGGEKLTGREREILRLVALGYTSCEIGERLGISDQTVNAHVKNVYRKLQVRTRAQAVIQASQWGLLD
ncbi:MAG: response regulator transcription factor [Comamonas sp.]